MAASRMPGPLGRNLDVSPFTPGVLGRDDAGAPDAEPWLIGNTPGALGRGDWAAPDHSALELGLRTMMVGFDDLPEFNLDHFKSPPPLSQKAALRQPPRPAALANARIDTFASGTGAGAFKKIQRVMVASGLRQRVQDPDGIEQGTSSLCGPAALVRTVALTDPVAYVTFVTSLYETGRGQIGGLKVAAGYDLLNYDPGSDVAPVDWIPIASIRDSENWFFDYQAAENQFAGITLPSHMEAWFRKIGFREVINETNLVVTKGEDSLHRANDLFQRDYWVCLFVNANMLHKAKMRNMSATADHWVVLTSSITISPKSVSFAVFSWGQGHNPVPESDGPLSLGDLLKNYYGFVATRR